MLLALRGRYTVRGSVPFPFSERLLSLCQHSLSRSCAILSSVALSLLHSLLWDTFFLCTGANSDPVRCYRLGRARSNERNEPPRLGFVFTSANQPERVDTMLHAHHLTLLIRALGKDVTQPYRNDLAARKRQNGRRVLINQLFRTLPYFCDFKPFL